MSTNDLIKAAVAVAQQNGATGEQVAQVEIAIQYLTNPDFRAALEDYVFHATYQPKTI